MIDNQVGLQNGHRLSIYTCVSLWALSFFTWFLPNFLYDLLPSNSGSSLNMGFFGHMITKMADKMATACQFAFVGLCGHSNLVIFLPIFSKFHI